MTYRGQVEIQNFPSLEQMLYNTVELQAHIGPTISSIIKRGVLFSEV